MQPRAFAILAIGLLLGISPTLQVSAEDHYLSTSPKVCGEKITEPPSGFDVDLKGTQELLHGVWLGYRESWSETVPSAPADYMMILDLENKESLIYELRGKEVEENRFASLLPKPDKGAPEITYFYCGGSLFGPFRDRFVKVSGKPRQGLGALAKVTGIDGVTHSVFGALIALRKAGWFKGQKATELNTAFYTTALTPDEAKGQQLRDNIRLDLVGQLIGAVGGEFDGQPRAGHESGVFHGVRSDEGRYLASIDASVYAKPEIVDILGKSVGVLVPCNGSNPIPEGSDEHGPLEDFLYTKVIIGPFPS